MKLNVSKDITQDAVNIKAGVYAPLAGFLGKDDFESVLDNMTLVSGKVWSMPIVIDINEEQKNKLEKLNQVELIGPDNESVVLNNIEIYLYSKEEWAKKIYGTTDKNHPGVEEVFNRKKYLLGGKVLSVENYKKDFSEHNFTPRETKKIFKERGWKTIGAFQTRNVPHRAHEFLQKYLLEIVDGLLVQPVIGEKKLADFKDEYIVASYEILLDKYFSRNKTLLAVLPLKMRYAGPREAVMHAIIRKNFGCTHFIVGRDHAGVGDYYPPTAAQDIFDEKLEEEIGIKIIKPGEVAYDKNEGELNFIENCNQNDIIKFSGTKLRKYIQDKITPPDYILRKEIYDFLVNSHNSLVDNMYKNNKNNKGFVLWFTGLSAAGKTTLADLVYERLKNNGNKLERLDGDVARENLTKDLGFSREDRDENLRRIGYVASLLSRNGVGVFASFISPYEEQRKNLRETIGNYIEVFVDTPLEVCEARDPKGMYKKARAGEIKNFTGISDPYERPKNTEIHLETSKIEKEKSVEKIIDYLKENKYID